MFGWLSTVIAGQKALRAVCTLDDPAIHLFRVMVFAKIDGYAGQARV
jgi:hypothetical protein